MRHLTLLLDAVWMVAMGLFLGLGAGLVLGVILVFRGSRHMQASPGLSPYADPRFAEYHTEAVAGSIGQSLFALGGSAALILLALAVTTRIAAWALNRRAGHADGGKVLGVQRGALVLAVLLMAGTAATTMQINDRWPGLYDTQATDAQLIERRDAFDALHQRSERLASLAWLSALVALAVTPWCPRESGAFARGG
ncbi:MAG: hypothetical protein AAGC44_10495 [Planctomycetota bacterium]